MDESVEVTYKFFLPTHEREKAIHDKAQDMQECLHEIFTFCRDLIKYDDDASEEATDLAEQIRDIIVNQYEVLIW